MKKEETEIYDTFFSEQRFLKIRNKTILRDWAQEKLGLRKIAEDQIISEIQRQMENITLERERLETVYIL